MIGSDWGLECHRHAPALYLSEDRTPPIAFPRWPVVGTETWCGDHEPIENAEPETCSMNVSSIELTAGKPGENYPPPIKLEAPRFISGPGSLMQSGQLENGTIVSVKVHLNADSTPETRVKPHA